MGDTNCEFQEIVLKFHFSYWDPSFVKFYWPTSNGAPLYTTFVCMEKAYPGPICELYPRYPKLLCIFLNMHIQL